MPTPLFLFRSIKPATKFKSSVFREQFLAAANRIAPKIETDLKRPTSTWKGEKPAFETTVRVGNAAGGNLAKKATGSASGIVIESTTSNEVYGFLNDGTSVRYATMTPDFQPKTKVNDLRAYRGRGGRAFINRRRPRPGIKARGWVKMVRKKWTTEFRQEMQRALTKATALSGHSARK